MWDLPAILTVILLTLVIGIVVKYHGTIRKAQREYERARDLVNEIVLSFNRQLKAEATKLELLAYKIEGLASKSEGATHKAEELEKQVNTLGISAGTALKSVEDFDGKMKDYESRLRDAGTSHESVISRITVLETQLKQASQLESSIDAVIPLRRDKALAHLTETELAALEYLVSEGPKTAPEIKARIELSREHTARLMKKLFENGYLERDTTKVPFKYSIKAEMEKMLRRTEAP